MRLEDLLNAPDLVFVVGGAVLFIVVAAVIVGAALAVGELLVAGWRWLAGVRPS